MVLGFISHDGHEDREEIKLKPRDLYAFRNGMTF
jgi:hypothetical protein